MKNLFSTLLTLLCVAVAVPTMAQETASEPQQDAQVLMLTLEDALRIALEENPTVQIADQTVEAKKYAKRGTYAALWPEISASATYQRYIKKQRLHFSGQTIEVGTANNYSAGIQAALPFRDRAVQGHLFTGLDDDDIAYGNLVGENLLDFAVTLDVGCVGTDLH